MAIRPVRQIFMTRKTWPKAAGKVGIGIALALSLAMLSSSCSSTGRLTGPELVPLAGQPSGDYVQLEGSWVVTYNELRKVPTPERAGATFNFKENRFWISGDTGHEWFAVDSSRTPKAIDFYNHKSQTIRGIYELNGSELTLCTAAPGESRPTDFKTSPLSGTILAKLRKAVCIHRSVHLRSQQPSESSCIIDAHLPADFGPRTLVPPGSLVFRLDPPNLTNSLLSDAPTTSER